jgi:hypothetical protein
MAAFVQTLTAQSTSGTTPLVSGAFTTSTTSGNFLVVAIGNDSGLTGTITSITDSKGNTYAKANDIATSVSLSVWYAANITGGSSHTITVNFNDSNTGNVSIVAQEFSGIMASGALDKTAAATGTSTSPSSGATATTTQANELVVASLVTAGTATTTTAGAGYSNLGGPTTITDARTAQASKIVAATGTQTATFTLAASRTWACIVTTFKVAPAFNPRVASGFIGFFNE